MSDIFDRILHDRGRKGEKLFTINIGAMDGLMFDELSGYSGMYNFSGLYVEPIPYLFNRLKNNLDNGKNIFENAAISEYNGSITMLTIDQEAIDSGLVHECFYGMSAVYPPKNGLASEGDKDVVEKHGKLVEVPCITLEELFKKHNITSFDVFKLDTEGHDYKIFQQLNFEKYRPSLIRMEWVNLSNEEQSSALETLKQYDYYVEFNGQDLLACPNEVLLTLDLVKDVKNEIIIEPNKKLTLVTGLWNIKRDSLTEGWSRTFEHYLEKFDQLLKVENPMIIYGDESLRTFVMARRSPQNTLFVARSDRWFNNEFYDKIQSIRTNETWLNQSGWLRDSTQAKLDMYNPLVMSKMFLLHDAKLMDPFNSEQMFWIDAGLTNTVHQGYFTHDKVLDKLPKYINKFSFVCFPYEANTEIHGFTFSKINQIAGQKVELVGRGGFFGGPKESITDINGIYYGLMSSTLNQGLMGTEESLFSIMVYKHADLVDYFEIEGNGLFGKFFEDLKNDRLERKNKQNITPVNDDLSKDNTALYVITFNSPKQFETLIQSMYAYDESFVKKPKKFLLDNSSDLSTTERYKELCNLHGFEHIKKDNLGICGGRQWIAEHAEENNFDFYFFFEDDMFFFPKKGEVCRNGFSRYVPNLYDSTIEITKKYHYDFLKFNYSEFYGDNGVQWSWYNVPQHYREQRWPEKSQLPVQGQDPNAPRTLFKHIRTYKGIPFVDGEIYYCNWPQVVTRHGNKKMFLTEKWAHPFEQTWMSYMYQETVKGNLNPAMLLLTPTEHDRFDFYDGKLRKES
jgi:FkbM family methyltransferase